METLADRVKLAMERRGLGFNELGRKMGKKPGYVSALVAEGRKPRADNIEKLAEALEVRLEWLLRGELPIDAVPPAAPPEAASAAHERVIEYDETDPYPNRRALRASSHWRDAEPEARAYVASISNLRGDYGLDEWLEELRSASRRVRRGERLDVLGREAEEDVVEDPDAG